MATTTRAKAIKSTKIRPVDKPTQVLIVDDHPIVRKGLVDLIAAEPTMQVCGEAADAAEVFEQIKTSPPDIILLDISLKDHNGIELIKDIKAINESIRVLVVSMHDEQVYAERALRAGALGYLNKDQAIENVVAAIQQVLRGVVYVSSNLADRILHRVIEGNKGLEQSPVQTLSDRELEVFELIGQGLTPRQIAQQLNLSIKTIQCYRENVKTKLSLSNTNELVRYAVQWSLERH